MSALLYHELPEPVWMDDPVRKLTPFELDNRRKSEALMRFRDERARKGTCANCGIIRQFHWEAKALGRCTGWKAMSKRQWAEECGVEFTG